MKVHEQIRKYRKQYNFSQEELADKIYVSRQTISNWENGKSYPDIENLLILSTLFHITLDELIKGDIEVMRKELDNHVMDVWTGVMLIFLVLGVVTGIPLTYALSWWGFGITIVLLVIGMGASIKVELIKKRHNIKTFKEIMAFTENKNLNLEDRLKSQKGYWKEQLLMIVGSAIITLVLAYVALIVTKLIMN
ncbi:helix-turn-helix transcriptional regulator [Companilactobacillus paralimentarius]|uniref:helix-turn-helix transcriptional regulator n=1 Tax=Companilactobacillus paralimentarius TaxID=83526 RepID=UPI0038515FE9